MNSKRGFTLLEVIIGSVLLIVAVGSLASIIMFYTRIQRKISESPAANMALTLETGVQSIFRAVNISDVSVVSIEEGGQTMIWKTQGGKLKRLKFNPLDGRIYYDDHYDTSKHDIISGQPVLASTSGATFSQDTNSGRVFLEVETRYNVQRGRSTEQRVTGMRTAVRSFLVRGLDTGPKRTRTISSPAIEGVVVTSKKEGDSLYAVVEADTVAIHTPSGFTKTAGKEVVNVLVPLSMPIQDYYGKRVMVNGDILPRKDGRYMVMNLMYGGGLVSDAAKIAEMHKNIQDGKEPWYEEQTANLQACFAMAKEKNVDMKDWKKVWDWMMYYYGEYIPSFEEKGTVKVKVPLQK